MESLNEQVYSPEVLQISEEISKNRERVLDAIREADAKYKEPEQILKYGTAGFRADADLLERAAFRVGLVVALRAKVVGTCGVMITASHNTHSDNGVKIIEPDGSMLK